MAEGRDAVFIHVRMQRRGTLMTVLGMLKSLPGMLLPGWVILLLMGLRGAAMSMSGIIV